jgi:hypothetical protein
MDQNTRQKSCGPKFKIFPKLLFSFLALSMTPLFILGYGASRNMLETGLESIAISREMGERNLQSAKEIGNRAIQDSVRQLDDKATEAIELQTMDLAQRIADFLYERDADIRMLATFKPDEQAYLAVYAASVREVTIPEAGQKDLKSGVPFISENPENKTAWRHRPPDEFIKAARPIYKEITFVGLE